MVISCDGGEERTGATARMMSERKNWDSKSDSKGREGTVSLIETNGHVGLFTVEGTRCLRMAEAIVFDPSARVIALNHARPDTELMEVGCDLPLAHVVSWVVERAKRGLHVARLIGGGGELSHANSGSWEDRSTDGGTVGGQGTFVNESEAFQLMRERSVQLRLIPGVTRGRPFWADRRLAPLLGCRVLVTRAKEQAALFSERLMALGAEPVEFPVVRTVSLEDCSRLDRALDGIGSRSYDWAIFTSANGVRSLLQRFRERGDDIRCLHGVKLAAIGPATADSLQAIGLQVDLMPSSFVAEALVEAFQNKLGSLVGQRMLLIRAQRAREVIPEELRRLGAEVEVAPVYRTIGDGRGAPLVGRLLQERALHVLTFTSSSTVTHFCRYMDDFTGLPAGGASELVRHGGARVACIGPITAETAREKGLPVHAVAAEYTIPGLTKTVAELWTRKR